MRATPGVTERELTATLIVAGAARSGKSTLLKAIHDRMTPTHRGTLMPVGEVQTPLLDWLPIDLGNIGSWDVRLNIYAVPPLIGTDATRRLILADTDGIIFVADSQAHRLDENLSALQQLIGELVDNGGDPRTVPVTILYSKQDLPSDLILPKDVLDDLINFQGAPSFSADALRGPGVLEALQSVFEPMLRGLKSPVAVGAGNG